MVSQTLIDDVADRLVELGIHVTPESLRGAFGDRDDDGHAHGISDPELHAAFSDWSKRRRYRSHLAILDLPDDMERALAAFAERALILARASVAPSAPGREDGSSARKPAEVPDLADMVALLRDEMSVIAEVTRALRGQVDALAASHARAGQPPKRRREGRRKGLAAIMGRVFWDRMMQEFVEAIRRQGPMTAAQLHATLDEDALHMAEAAFERVDVSLIAEKVEERVRRAHYFKRTEDGLYDAL